MKFKLKYSLCLLLKIVLEEIKTLSTSIQKLIQCLKKLKGLTLRLRQIHISFNGFLRIIGIVLK